MIYDVRYVSYTIVSLKDKILIEMGSGSYCSKIRGFNVMNEQYMFAKLLTVSCS